MSNWRSIIYRDFYDVPRAIMVSGETWSYLFDSTFDEGLDGYRDYYEVYEMPKLSDKEIKGSWSKLEQKAIRHLGRVPVKDVQFDATKRREIDLGILEHLKPKRDWRRQI